MKPYIGVKKIEADPMTRGDYNTYRGWQIPTDENPDDEGYHVKHADGHESWSPKEDFENTFLEKGKNLLNDTALLMKSTDFKERFKAEYEQLLIRITGLQRMLESYKAGKLPFQPNCSYELLYEQFVHMKGYLNALELRATIEKISLEKENKNEQSNCC